MIFHSNAPYVSGRHSGTTRSTPWLIHTVCETKRTTGYRYPNTVQWLVELGSGAVLQARLLDNQEGANIPNGMSSEKLSARCFPRGPFWHRHFPTAVEIWSVENRPSGV